MVRGPNPPSNNPVGNVTVATIIRRHHPWKPTHNPAWTLLRTTLDPPVDNHSRREAEEQQGNVGKTKTRELKQVTTPDLCRNILIRVKKNGGKNLGLCTTQSLKTRARLTGLTHVSTGRT